MLTPEEQKTLDNLTPAEKRELDLAKQLLRALVQGPVENVGGGVFCMTPLSGRPESLTLNPSDMYIAVRCLQRLGYGVERTDAGGTPRWILTSLPI